MLRVTHGTSTISIYFLFSFFLLRFNEYNGFSDLGICTGSWKTITRLPFLLKSKLKIYNFCLCVLKSVLKQSSQSSRSSIPGKPIFVIYLCHDNSKLLALRIFLIHHSVSKINGVRGIKFTSYGCRYYSLDAYHRKKIEKAIKKGSAKATKSERVVFNDEEQRRYVSLCILILIAAQVVILLTRRYQKISFCCMIAIISLCIVLLLMGSKARSRNFFRLKFRFVFNSPCFIFRLELQQEREKQKEAEVEALKRSMQSGMVLKLPYEHNKLSSQYCT